jgi:uncharacterized membrane protein YgcG
MAKNKGDRYASAIELLADLSALLDDPTHSTERARITGPRKKLPKKLSPSRYVVWIGGVAVIVAAVAVTVKVMMGGSSPAVVTPPDAQVAVTSLDAAVVAPPDVAPVPPARVDIKIETDPKGASILVDGLPGTGINGEKVTPMTLSVLETTEKTEFIIQLEGYEEKSFKKIPKEYDPKVGIPVIKLVKAKKPVQYTPPKQGPGSGTGTGPGSSHSSGGGDFGGFPGGGGGTVPNK